MREKAKTQNPKERIKNFTEVTLGFSQDQAVNEAKRCLSCKKPACIAGCPVEIDIKTFIEQIGQGKFIEALDKIKEKNNLPGICGRVCPQETQCEAVCVLNKKNEPINIGKLERFVSDNARSSTTTKPKLKKEKVATIGSGPAGLTCAADLAKMGYKVTIFESLHLSGGVLTYGIPEFRLPKKIVNDEIEYIKNLGVKIQTNMVIGKIYTLDELFKHDFSAIFIGTGAGLPQFLGIEGENLNRVYSANEFLTRVNLMKAYRFPGYDTPINMGKNVAVIGAGNVAMDAARSALRLGAEEVTIVYRRSEKEMPARIEEIEHAKEEGIKFNLLTAPKKIMADNRSYINGMECIKMELGQPDESGRRRPVPIKGSEFIFKCDTVIVAIGQTPHPLLIQASPKLKTAKYGNIVVDPQTMQTSIEGVFAGGDIVTGADTVISAMGAGKKSATAIDKYITQKMGKV